MTAEQCDLRALVALMNAGDIRALDAMVRCYSDRLVAVGRRCCRTDEDAEEAVQDALLQAGEQIRDYRGEGSPLAWLSSIVANRCRRMQRGQRNDPALHVTLEDSCACLIGTDSPETAVARAELAMQLAEAMELLSRTDRLLLILSAAEGWSGPELAEHFSLSPEAVRARLSRSRRRLRAVLTTTGYPTERP